MPRKILVDTNILLDIALPGRPERMAALLLAGEVTYEAGLSACVTSVSLKDVYYVLSKGGNEIAAREFVRQLLRLFEVLPVDADACRMAADSDEPDFEDGLVRVCAERAGVDYLISRDEKAFLRSFVKRLSAKEYIDLFCEVEEVDL